MSMLKRLPRSVCYRCMKPTVFCICDDIDIIRNRIGIFIVQHMRERYHAIGTARIAELGLENVQLETVFPTNGRFESAAVFPPGAALLYPHPEARYLETLTMAERPRQLVVIDGTWPQASRIYRDSPNLRALPCITFETPVPSNYRIRQEPNTAANATIEAICRALGILEADTPGMTGLIDCFDKMIDRQIRASNKRNRRTVRRRKPFKPKSVPRSLCDPRLNVVLACGSRLSGASAVHQEGHLWQWHAVRLSDTATFSAAVDDSELSVESFLASWRAFLRPNDVLVVWNSKPLAHLFGMTGVHPRFVALKAAWGSLQRGACRSVDEVLDRERLTPINLPIESFRPDIETYLCKMAAVVTYLERSVDNVMTWEKTLSFRRIE